MTQNTENENITDLSTTKQMLTQDKINVKLIKKNMTENKTTKPSHSGIKTGTKLKWKPKK